MNLNATQGASPTARSARMIMQPSPRVCSASCPSRFSGLNDWIILNSTVITNSSVGLASMIPRTSMGTRSAFDLHRGWASIPNAIAIPTDVM